MARPFARHLGAYNDEDGTVSVTDLAYAKGPRVGDPYPVRLADLNDSDAYKACAAVGVNPRNPEEWPHVHIDKSGCCRPAMLAAVARKLADGAPWRPINASGSEAHVSGVEAPEAPVQETPAPRPEMNREARRADPEAAKVEALVAMLRDLAGDSVNEAQVERIARRVASEVTAEVLRPQIIWVSLPDRQVVEIPERQHYLFAKVLTYCNARRNVWLYGPAGSGKSTLCENIAHALTLPFYSMSGGPDVSRYDLFGYRDGNGNVIRTPFREAFEFGGLFLFDEIDRNVAEGLTAVNQALANGVCAFPDGMVKRHPDCIFIGGANTIGTGATIDYIGALPIDASSKDRFSFIEMPYDEDLETVATIAIAGDEAMARDWLARVRRFRKNVLAANLHDFVVSPRASFGGAALLRAGVAMDDVISSEIRKGMSDEQWRKVNA